MSDIVIEKKPDLVYNSIPEQIRKSFADLTIEEYNQAINILKAQNNKNTEYLQKLHRVLFYDFAVDSVGVIKFDGLLESGIVGELIAIIHDLRNAPYIHIGDSEPEGEGAYLWFDISNN